MFGELLSAPFAPFSVALAILAGLLALEVILSLVGGSMMGADSPDAPDAEIDASPDSPAEGVEGAGGPMSAVASALGLGRAPVLIWLAALLTGFGVGGLVIQTIAASALGAPLSPLVAALAALLPGWGAARALTGLLAHLLPGTESQSVSEAALARRTGIVTQGTAARGRPAEVRVTDRFGNTHYLRAEPMSDGDSIAQGTRVVVLRDPRTRSYRLVALD